MGRGKGKREIGKREGKRGKRDGKRSKRVGKGGWEGKRRKVKNHKKAIKTESEMLKNEVNLFKEPKRSILQLKSKKFFPSPPRRSKHLRIWRGLRNLKNLPVFQVVNLGKKYESHN